VDGRDLCQALRSRGVQAPVLFLTARDSLPDRLSGFEAGGDDYVTKPFALAEVVARLYALARRAGADGAVEGAGLRLDPMSHRVSCGPGSTGLTPTEFRLLARLLASPDETGRRGDLVRAAWPHGAITREYARRVPRLRRKLRGGPAPEIATTASATGERRPYPRSIRSGCSSQVAAVAVASR
jgi:two-component system response regulator MprA